MSTVRRYRQSPVLLFGGVIFTAGGLVYGLWLLSQLGSGTPIMVKNSRSGVQTHPATSLELLYFGALSTVVILAGVSGMVYWTNCAVMTDDNEIWVKNMLGADLFRARWSELTGLEPYFQRGSCYRLAAGDRRVNITGRSNYDDLLEDIFRHAPQIPRV